MLKHLDLALSTRHSQHLPPAAKSPKRVILVARSESRLENDTIHEAVQGSSISWTSNFHWNLSVNSASLLRHQVDFTPTGRSGGTNDIDCLDHITELIKSSSGAGNRNITGDGVQPPEPAVRDR